MRCPLTGKVMHASRTAAKKACKAVQRNYGQKKHPYLCDPETGCGQWHIGEMPKWMREGREKAPGGRV